MEYSPDLSTERVVAFIDIGTNSIRLLLVNLTPNHSYNTLAVRKETVRLGEGEFSNGYLNPLAMQRAILVCRQFADMARSHGAHEVVTVATSATREAKNKYEFLQLLEAETQLDVRTISGREEARLIYLGISSGVYLEERSALMIDIGGGSTELIIGDHQGYHFLDSLKIGAVRLSSIFFTPEETGPIDPSRYALLQQYVRNTAIRSFQEIEKLHFDIAYGSSGTIENIADIAAYLYFNRRWTRDDVLSYENLVGTIEHLRSLSLDERREVQGINQRRADIIIAGGAILHTIMQEFNIKELRVTNRSLRDGMLVDYLRHEADYAQDFKESARKRSVTQVMRKFSVNEEHALQVAKLTLELFDATKAVGLHELGDRYRGLLEDAALLHDVGIFLSYSNHQSHSYYLIRNADLLGFDQEEIAIIAATSYFHRKQLPQKKHKEFASLQSGPQQAVKVMATLLSIAESLDRSHKSAISGIHVRDISKKKVALEIFCDRECQLELWGVEYQKKVFRRVFGKDLIVQVHEEDTLSKSE